MTTLINYIFISLAIMASVQMIARIIKDYKDGKFKGPPHK
jgi:hypothetical protein